MEIYIGNLPDQLNPKDLRKIVRYVLLPSSFSGLIGHLFKKNGKLGNTRFEVVEDANGSRSVRYAYADIQPDIIARRVIQRLDHLTFNGASLRAREFIKRNLQNDRRKKTVKNLYSVDVYNRRIADRRTRIKNE